MNIQKLRFEIIITFMELKVKLNQAYRSFDFESPWEGPGEYLSAPPPPPAPPPAPAPAPATSEKKAS